MHQSLRKTPEIITMDAFGNLTEVDETDPTLGAVSTYYTYDILNHLIQVRMPRGSNTQLRTFDYTGGTNTVGTLLMSATNPENGTVTYTYSNGLIATKTDAKNNQFAYTYDSLHRISQVSANGNVLRTFYYDTNPFDSSPTFTQYTSGRLTAIQYATTKEVNASEVAVPYTFTEMFAYNQAPAIATKRLRLAETITYPTGTSPPYAQKTVSGDLNTTYTYDNEGHVTSTGYPATVFDGPGANYSYQFDGQKRPTGMTDQNNNTIAGATWGPANELDSISYLGYAETRGYNTMFQLTSINGNTYTYPAGANIRKISSQVISGETVSYTYDTLNRLASATGSGWSQTFVYDGFGNLTNRIPTGTAPSSPATPADPATNRLSGFSYDANGNLLTVGYVYDAENRLISAVSGSVQYLYDSQNKRIWQGNYATDFNGNLYLSTEQVFFYGVDGKKLGAYNPTVQYGGISGQIPQSIVFNAGYSAKTNVYFGGRLIQQGGTTFIPDRLESNGKYFPYGEERNYPTLPNDQVKFATYTRDSATGLDYADQRNYASAMGRFVTPDPYKASGTGSDPGSPQSWNRYSYVQGDPVNYYDPWGLYIATPPPAPPPAPPAPPAPNPGPGPGPGPGPTGPPCTAGPAGLDPVACPGSGGGGGGSNVVSRAEQIAKQWLKNADCAKLFDLSGNGFDPQQVLASLIDSGSYTNGLVQIRMSTLDFGTSALGGLTVPNISYITIGIIQVPAGIGADIFINTNATDVTETAEAILEELGHAYNYTSGSGGSTIVYDNPLFAPSYTDPVTGQSESAGQYNFNTIMRACNK